ncbi:hypothetical protein GCM10009628_27420 [Paeniglutamicibacter kerguelensis]|uniref:CubicO group peptidase (Beta-lactamase class C family) n=1 Tax=Paeniglutamicibacter kerguelensis TaxID=254788 RepID=A0ABS4XAQ2_9MICC|nr:CubicO group peptidase (beta-lactamase class C family) [Paeniglutamicibacter kerguelensis]
MADPANVVKAAPGASGTLPKSVVATLDSGAKAAFETAAAPGAIVGVRTPQGIWTAAYGLADPTTKAPMTTDMHARIGSVAKTFTGTLLLQLAEEGKLGLDDPIGNTIPAFPMASGSPCACWPI